MGEDTKRQEERRFQLEQLKIQLEHDAFNSIMSALIAIIASALVVLIGIVFTVDLPASIRTILSIFSVLMGVIFMGTGILYVWVVFKYFPRRIDNLQSCTRKSSSQAERRI